MNIQIKEVQGFNLTSIPKEHETIDDDLHIDEIVKHCRSIAYYLRSPEVCPFGRGNWILDIEITDGSIICFKLPKEMTQEHFMNYIKPLMDKFHKKCN